MDNFADKLRKKNVALPKYYLDIAKRRAKKYGLDPLKLGYAPAPHKLQYDGVPFGHFDYNDYILYKIGEAMGQYKPEEPEKKRAQYLARATNIPGDWKKDKISPNNLAIHILW